MDSFISIDTVLYFIQKIRDKIFSRSVTDREIVNVLGLRPGSFVVYRRALIHRSVKDSLEDNNERLEYLGDAILGGIIADYLFKHYPFKSEGFLTEMRSKMVNRQQLNEIAVKMGLKKITQYNKYDNALRNSQIFGNTFEAIVGAIYLDKGYEKTQTWVVQHVIKPYLFVDELEQADYNQKNKLIGWASKHNKLLRFDVLDEQYHGSRKQFKVAVFLDEQPIGTGLGFSKKEASETAAQNAIENLQI
ncbi:MULTISPECIES: ribonuclease III [Chitinophagaceae]